MIDAQLGGINKIQEFPCDEDSSLATKILRPIIAAGICPTRKQRAKTAASG